MANSALIGALRVALGLDTAQFEAGANKARQRAKQTAGDIETSFKSAKTAVEGLFAAFAVGALVDQVKKSLDYAGSLAEVSRTLGVTTKDLQTFRFAASQSGVAQDELEVGLRRLTVSMGKAELGSKAQAKAFAAIGISVDQLKGKNTGDVFRLMADGLSKVTDRSQRAAIEMTLMGRSGSTLDNLLAPGARRLNELADAAQKLGIVLSDSQIQGAEETAHKLAAVKEVLAAQIAGVVANNANAILSLSSALATLTGQIIKFLGSNPQLALAIIGGLAGGRIAGAAGAVAGAAGGAILGEKVAQSAADSNTDLAFRTQQMRAAQSEYFARLRQQDSSSSLLGGLITVRHGDGRQGGGTVQSAQAEFFRQLGLLKNATAQARASSVTPAGSDVPQIFAGGDKKPKKAPKDKNEADIFAAQQEERQIELQILDAKKQLSHDYVEQTTLSIQQLDVQKAITDADIQHKVEQAKVDFAAGKITQETLDRIVAEAGITKAKEDELDGLKRRAVLEAEQEQRFKDIGQLDDQEFGFRRQKLQAEAALAQTAKERREIGLQLLDLDYQEQKAQQDRILADTEATDQQKELARRALDQLGKQYSLDRAGVIQQTQGPLEQYMSSLPTSAAKWTEALQSVAVDGFGKITDSIDPLVNKVIKLGGVFGDVARTIIADLLKIELQKMVIAPLANALSGVFGGGGVVDLTGAQYQAQIPHFAGGGSMTIGGNAGIDQNTLALNNMPIAKVGYGETLSIDNGKGGGKVVVYQTIAPNFAGNAATQSDLAKMAMLTKQATLEAFDQKMRRK